MTTHMSHIFQLHLGAVEQWEESEEESGGTRRAGEVETSSSLSNAIEEINERDEIEPRSG